MVKVETRHFNASTDNGYGFFTHVVKNVGNGYHNHDYIEILLVLEGTMRTIINEKAYELPKNTLVFFRPSDIHAYCDNHEVSHRDLCFKTDFFTEVCDFLDKNLFNNYLQAPDAIILSLDDYQMLQLETLSQKTSFNIDIKLIDVLPQIKILLLNLLELLYTEQTRMMSTIHWPDYLNKLLNELENNNNISNHSLDEILDSFHYNKTYLRRVFKRYLKMDLNKYWLDKKLTRAATLLKTTNMKVNEISQTLGFQSYAYFNKRFVERYGITPSKYRSRS